MALAASATGAFAAPASADLNSAKEEAISRLEAYVNASPFGHKALVKGVNDIAAASVGSVSAVNAFYASAIADATESLGEDLYRVRVTLANVGVNKDNAGKPKLLAVDAPDFKNNVCMFVLSESVNNASVWRFNIAGDGLYTIASNVGQYIGHRDPEHPELGDLTEVIGSKSVLTSRNFKVVYAEDKAAFALVSDGEYLSLDADGKLVFTETESDYSLWTMSRAYDESMDLPKFSTDENPIYYVFNNKTAGYLTLRGGSEVMTCSGRDEYSYWYLVNQGGNSGTFYLKNKKDGLVVTGNTANGNMYLTQSNSPIPLLFFMLPDNEGNGWSMTFRNHNLSNFDYTNPLVVTYVKLYKWIQGTAPQFKMEDLGIYSWSFQEITSQAEEENFVRQKAESVKVLSDYKSYSPWCIQMLDNYILNVSNVEINDYASVDEAIEAIKKIESDAVANLYNAINGEARGCNVKISNVRRSRLSNAGEVGWYLTAVDKDGSTMVNTAAEPDNKDGFWTLEADESNTYAFRIRNQHGVYICNASVGTTAATTTDVASAGTFWLYPHGGYLRILNADGASALNLDTYGSDLVGYSFADEGSAWAFEKVAIINHEEGMPEISEGTESKLYVIRSAADPDDVWLFDVNTIGLTHGTLSANAHCYFTKANDGSDGVQIVSHRYATRLCYASAYLYCMSRGWETDPAFNLYIVPNGIEGKEGFVISATYPPTEYSCVSRKTSNPAYPYLISMGSPQDWENTSWIFEAVGEVDHEAIFEASRKAMQQEVESYMKAVPFAHAIFENLHTILTEAKMTDYGTETPAAVNALKAVYNKALVELEAELEVEPDGQWVSIANARLRGDAETGAYLTATGNQLKANNSLTDAGIWKLEYASNGRYRLCNAQGMYVGGLSGNVTVTADKAGAGLYTLDLLNGYISLVDRSDAANRALHLDVNNTQASVYLAVDEGSRWIMELAVPSGLDAVGADGITTAEPVYYNMTGVKVAQENLTPGVYLRVCGSEAVKVIIR